MHPQRLGGLHRQAIAAQAAKGVTVGADEKVNIGRAQGALQTQVPAALEGRDLGVEQVAVVGVEKAVVPGKLHQVAEESAGQLVAAGLNLDCVTEVQQCLGAQIGIAGVEIGHVLLAGRVAKQKVGGGELRLGRRYLGVLEGHCRTAPGLLQGGLADIAPAQPGAEIALHRHAEIAARDGHRRPVFDPLAAGAGADLIGDDAIVHSAGAQFADVAAQQFLHFLPPDLRGE